MAVVVAPALAHVPALVLHNIGWDTYERLLADHAERRAPRFTFDRGELEVMSPSAKHERDSVSLTLLVEIVAGANSIPVLSVGSMTYKRRAAKRGFEPDASFYIGSEPLVGGKEEIDPEVDPPPDLVVEVDVANSSLDRLSVFAGLGVPEVWRWVAGQLHIYLLHGDAYREADRSAALPMLTRENVTKFMAESRSMPRPIWLRSLTEWAEGEGAAGAPIG